MNKLGIMLLPVDWKTLIIQRLSTAGATKNKSVVHLAASSDLFLILNPNNPFITNDWHKFVNLHSNLCPVASRLEKSS
jgi:hypothetical protein